MSAYRGHLTTVVGDGPEVLIKLSGPTVQVLTPDGRVHTWPSEGVRVTGISGSRFWLAFDDEIAVFAPEHPEAFMLEFLPGLKAARTVASAIEAAIADDSPAAPVEAPRRLVAAHKPKLPSLAEHVKAARRVSGSLPERQVAMSDDPLVRPAERKGTTSIGSNAKGVSVTNKLPNTPHPESTEDNDVKPETNKGRRWWSRGQTPPPLRTAAEAVEVDLTDEALQTADDQEDAPSESGLLRSLATSRQEFESGRRGTYKPRR